MTGYHMYMNNTAHDHEGTKAMKKSTLYTPEERNQAIQERRAELKEMREAGRDVLHFYVGTFDRGRKGTALRQVAIRQLIKEGLIKKNPFYRGHHTIIRKA